MHPVTTQTATSVYEVTAGRQCERTLHTLDQCAQALTQDPTFNHNEHERQRRDQDGAPTTAEPWRRRCVRLRSAAGPTAGRLWTAQAGAPGTNLTDAEWRTATRYRLGSHWDRELTTATTERPTQTHSDRRAGSAWVVSDAMHCAAPTGPCATRATTRWPTWSQRWRKKRAPRSHVKRRYDNSKPTDQRF